MALLLLFNSLLYARSPVFMNLTTKDGLSRDWIHCFHQDKSGFLWIGTEDGLNKYNGYEFQVYHFYPGDSTALSGPSVYSIAEDTLGVLYIGTKEGGISVYDHENDNFKWLVTSNSGLNSNLIRTIVRDQYGELLIGTVNGGLNIYNPYDHSWKYFTTEKPFKTVNLTRNYVNALMEDKSGALWIGTYCGGVNYLNPSRTGIRHIPAINKEGRIIPYYCIHAVHQDNEGTVWIGSRNGLFRYNLTDNIIAPYLNGSPSSFSDMVVRAVLTDENKNLWVGTESNGIFSLKTGEYNQHHSHVDDFLGNFNARSVQTIYLDNSGTLWTGSYAGGINYYHPTANKFLNTISDRIVRAFCKSYDSLVWIGGDILAKYCPENDSILNYIYQGNTILCLLEDHDQNLWIGTWQDGLKKYNPEDHITITYMTTTTVSSVYQDHNQNLWFGTSNGIYPYDEKSNIVLPFSDGQNDQKFKHLNTNYFLEDKQNNIWLGNKNSLLIYDPLKKNLQSLFPDAFSDNTIHCIYEDIEGNIWIACKIGLARVQPDKNQLKFYYSVNGLPSNHVLSITESTDSQLWITTVNGIATMDKATGNFTVYNTEDGLPAKDIFTSLSLSNNKILFGSSKGLSILNTDNIERNTYKPPVVISRVLLDNNPLKKKPQYEFDHNHALITFEFAALNYIYPKKNQYAYQLQKNRKNSKNWNNIDHNRKVSFAGLAPGRYTLKVMASNNDGIWNHQESTLNFRILPPFWLSWYTYIIYALFI